MRGERRDKKRAKKIPHDILRIEYSQHEVFVEGQSMQKREERGQRGEAEHQHGCSYCPSAAAELQLKRRSPPSTATERLVHLTVS